MTIHHDLRDAIRQLRRRPGFAAAAVLSLSLGIGATTSVFSLLDQVLLRTLPVFEPQQLARVRWDGLRYGVTMGGGTLSYPAYREIRDRNEVFSGVLCRFQVPLSVGYQGQTERVAGELVSGNYFEVLHVGAALGRTLTPNDDRVPGGHPLAMLSHDYWVARFGADPGIVGRVLVVDGLPMTIVGVGRQGFDGVELGYSPKLWIPAAMKAQMTQGWFSEAVTLENPRTFWVQVFARLKPGVTREFAAAALQPGFHAMLRRELEGPGFEAAGADIREAFLRSSLVVEAGAQGRTSMREDYETSLKVLMAFVALVLLIACANVASLLLERAIGREREIAVRIALGARGGQIVRHVLVESVLLAGLGGIAGLLVAAWATDMLVRIVATDDWGVNLVTTPDLRVMLFTLTTCLATGILFGLAPALASRGLDPAPALKREDRGVAGGQQWLRVLLVSGQLALSLVLVVGAGQFTRTLMNLRRVDTGLQMDNVIVFAVNPSLNGYDKGRSREFYRVLLERLRTLPGIEAVGASAIRVLEDNWWGGAVTVEGSPPLDDPGNSSFNLVSPGYLAALRIPLLAGRDFNAADAHRKDRVALVNESFVRRYFNGQSPIGRRISLGPAGAPPDIEIVGVMQDAKYTTLRDAVNPQAFLDNDQNPEIQSIHVYLKTALAPQQTYAMVRETVRALDSNVPVFEMRTMGEQAGLTASRERLVASLALAFGLIATVLAAVGLYAMMAFNVTRRTREIGVRVALGAARAQVVWLVLRQVLGMAAAGTAIALPIAWGVARLMRAQFYGVEPWDWISVIVAALSLLAVAAVASLVPARRAAGIDPIQALRTE